MTIQTTRSVDEVIGELEESYIASSPRSRDYFERGQSSMAGAPKGAYFHKPYPLAMDRGEGCYLYDLDGRCFVDCANHHTAQILGHANPAVAEVVRRQLERGIVLGAPMGVEAEMCEEMCRRVASLERIRFCNSGTEATLHAIRLARFFSGRGKVAKFEGGYHGSHDAVEISVSPPLDQAGPPEAPVALPTAGGMAPNAAENVVILPYDDEAAVERLVEQYRDDLACIIFDPKAGIWSQRREFVQAVRECARKNGVLFILDEIVGFRVAMGGLQEHYGIDPDLTTYGKVVGGGFPAGAFGGRAELMDLLDNSQGGSGIFQSGTFSAHPMVMGAGMATLRQLTPEAFAHLNGLGERLREGLEELFEREQIAAKIVVLGSLFSLYFTDREVTNYRVAAKSNQGLSYPIFLALLEQGYYLNQGLGMCALSLPMAASHVDGLVEAVGVAIERVT